MEVGVARGWDVWPVENGEWAWKAWDHRLSRSGSERSEVEAQAAAQRELERILAEGRAAAQPEPELPERETRPQYTEPSTDGSIVVQLRGRSEEEY